MKNNILEESYKNPVITDKTIENIKKYPRFYTASPVRTRIGKIYTNKEFARKSDTVLSREMPGKEKIPVLKKIFKPKRK